MSVGTRKKGLSRKQAEIEFTILLLSALQKRGRVIKAWRSHDRKEAAHSVKNTLTALELFILRW
jgi:hypothetical protein